MHGTTRQPLTAYLMITAARAVGWLGVVAITVLSLVPGSFRPHVLAVSQFEHVAAYALTAVALVLGYPGRRAPRTIVLLLTFYAALMELAQLFIPGRNASLIDIAAGGLGAGIGAMLVLLLRRTRCEPPGAGPT